MAINIFIAPRRNSVFYFGNLLLSLTGSLMSILCKIHGTYRLLLNPGKKTKRKRKNRFKLKN